VSGDIIMTDAEVAKMFHLSTYSLQRKMREGFRADETDLSKARHECVGRRRWWYRPSVEALVSGKLS